MKLKPFFKSSVDFSKIEKVSDVLNIPVTQMEIIPSDLEPIFNELNIKTVGNLAEFEGDLEIEGFSDEDTNLWVMYAEMIKYYATAAISNKDKKILFVGLENAGKTSIIKILQERYSALKTILPTKGVNREEVDIFGYSVMVWDLGGQEQYRKQYIDKPAMYFCETDIIVFCFDIQEKEKKEDALDYFKSILLKIKELNIKVPILVVFTKYDPDVQSYDEPNLVRLEIMDKIQSMNDLGLDIGFAISSIFDRNSIEEVFSLVLKRISTSNVVIEEMLKIYMKNIKARAICLTNEGGLLYGSTGMTDEDENLVIQTGTYLQTMVLFHRNAGLLEEEYFHLKYPRNSLYFICEKVQINNTISVNLWILTEDLRSETLTIKNFKDDLIPLVDLFL